MTSISFLLRGCSTFVGAAVCMLLPEAVGASPQQAPTYQSLQDTSLPPKLKAGVERLFATIRGMTVLSDLQATLARNHQVQTVRLDNQRLNWISASPYGPLLRPSSNTLIDWDAMGFNVCTGCVTMNASLKDSAGNIANMQGHMQPAFAEQYTLDVRVTSGNFNWLHVASSVANQLYGTVNATTNLHITGSAAKPVISGNITLDNSSRLTLVLPQTNTNKDAAGAVVRFIDRSKISLPEPASLKPTKEPTPDIKRYLQQQLDIRVTPGTVLNIVIDPSAGDALQVQGKATLKPGVDSAGHILLSGKYHLDSGFYTLNYQFLRKQFALLPGSSILFNGLLADAVVSIDAVYVANSSAQDLIGNEIGTIDPSLGASFKRTIPFDVILHLKGPLKKPAISFDIRLPEEDEPIDRELRKTIQNKLAQLQEDPASVNKQVFSLLLMNRFVGEQSTDFFKGSGTGFNDISRESVSKFLSSALDNIAADLFKGLDIEMNPGTYRDYGNGDAQQKAAFNMSVTKGFINDRLTITVGRSFGIEGQDANAKAAQQKGLALLPDVTSSLQLTADGKYLMRSYRKSPFETVIDGFIAESGLGFSIKADYDTIDEILRRNHLENNGQ